MRSSVVFVLLFFFKNGCVTILPFFEHWIFSFFFSFSMLPFFEIVEFLSFRGCICLITVFRERFTDSHVEG
ncbi:hypothetical protein L1987_81423 [Smallanthus sonchifolius]|uniref:Uncharacterized protein n=1 Tax=Smallanthus sonchifolius TaxID=185202 RepID=A0ACB8YR51_9ASTR|nr:hypothetical protein L1987_81423 [Smallanthus sonchifolius]